MSVWGDYGVETGDSTSFWGDSGEVGGPFGTALGTVIFRRFCDNPLSSSPAPSNANPAHKNHQNRPRIATFDSTPTASSLPLRRFVLCRFVALIPNFSILHFTLHFTSSQIFQ